MQARALVEEGKTYAVYLHVDLPRKPKAAEYAKKVRGELTVKLPAGSYQVDWLDTKSGNIAATRSLQHSGGAVKLMSPQFVVDVALSIRRR
jgi:hypothetical protein